jgi:uncharacterized protein YkwD
MRAKHIHSHARLILGRFALVLLFIYLVLPVMAEDKLFRISDKTAYSYRLGVMTTPALVISNNRSHPGIYVTTSPNSALGQNMKLAPGIVLLTLDGYRITSSKMADGWLGHRSDKPLTFTYAVAVNGKSKIFSGQVQLSPSTIQPSTSTSASPGVSSGRSASAPSMASEADLAVFCLSLINGSRANNGLGPLRDDGTLARFASDYANYMAKNAKDYEVTSSRNPHKDLYGRSQLDRAQLAGITNFLNENIGRASRETFTDQQTLSTLHSQFMESEDHRMSILDPEAHVVGIGIARLPTRFYLTEAFGK